MLQNHFRPSNLLRFLDNVLRYQQWSQVKILFQWHCLESFFQYGICLSILFFGLCIWKYCWHNLTSICTWIVSFCGWSWAEPLPEGSLLLPTHRSEKHLDMELAGKPCTCREEFWIRNDVIPLPCDSSLPKSESWKSAQIARSARSAFGTCTACPTLKDMKSFLRLP